MSMHDQISSLLYEGEGATLDFKSEQYKFAGASEDEKSELLKDILAFSNAWRRTDAYILIGVKEVKGERATPVGITDHLDDAHLQQFINSKTNRPITFSYSTIEYENVKLGIIKIPTQKRPFYLAKDFGKVKSNTVYLRRGSSTHQASIEEISTMGLEAQSSSLLAPSLDIFLVQGEHEDDFAKSVACSTKCIDFPEAEHIPDYKQKRQYPFDIQVNLFDENRNFFREIAEYFSIRDRVHPIKLGIRNSGDLAARDVKVNLAIDCDTSEIYVTRKIDLPNYPSKRRPLHLNFNNFSPTATDVKIKESRNGWIITADFGKVQPKATIITKTQVMIGAISSRKVELAAQAFSDDLSIPHQEVLTMEFDVSNRTIPLDELLKFQHNFD